MARFGKLGLIAGLAAMLVSAATARADDAVSLRLNWQILGFHAPFYYGVKKGFYKEEGIDLTGFKTGTEALAERALAAMRRLP